MSSEAPSELRASSGDQPVIRVRGLTAAYGSTVVLRDVTFDIRHGEVFVILGGSGCGKSTLLKHMIGLHAPATGSVEIEGRDITEASGEKRRAILRRMGVTFQGGALFGSMTLLQNVSLPLVEFTNLPLDAAEFVARMKLSLVGLAEHAQRLPAEISGGMNKRAALARALALDPPVVLLDEPSAGLDPVTSAGLDALVRRLSHSLGVTFVVVTHELPSIYAIADRCVMLDAARRGIAAIGRPADLRDKSTDPVVARFFNREAS